MTTPAPTRAWRKTTFEFEATRKGKVAAPPVTDWKKARQDSTVAHKVLQESTHFYLTVCGVGLRKKRAVNASRATMLCVECRERIGQK